jgi:hypothetical protein
MDSIPGQIAAANDGVRRQWEAAIESDGIGADEPYNAMAVLARVLYDQSTDESLDLAHVFAAIERELVAADGRTRNLLIVGLLEDLQNFSLSRGRELDTWVHWMGPATLAGWRMVEKLWSGSVSPAGFNAFVDTPAGDSNER